LKWCYLAFAESLKKAVFPRFSRRKRAKNGRFTLISSAKRTQMGGFGSGCPYGSRYRPVEQAFGLDAAALRRADYFHPGGKVSGSWAWWWGDDPEPAATVGIEIDLIKLEDPNYRVYYASRDRETGVAEKVDIKGALLQTSPPYGGVRWWFACPRCGRRRRVLYLPRGGHSIRFACRRCHSLRYTSQRESGAYRMIRKARKLWRRAGSKDNLEPTEKPKWMRLRTFERLVEAGQDAMDRGDLLILYGTNMPASLRLYFPGFEEERSRALAALAALGVKPRRRY
jgi:hypothetical protein